MYLFEHTDTFGGEANYGWCNRTAYGPCRTPYPSRRELIRAAKAFAGLTGLRCRVTSYGDGYEIRPSGMCQVVFVQYLEAYPDGHYRGGNKAA